MEIFIKVSIASAMFEGNKSCFYESVAVRKVVVPRVTVLEHQVQATRNIELKDKSENENTKNSTEW